MMNEYRFHLEKYRLGNRYTCPNCERKRCFTRYIDDEGEVSFPDNVGKCDHEHSCGYHYTPKDYFREHPDFLSKDKLPYPTRRNIQPKVVEKPISYIANTIMERSLSHYGINPLYQYLSKVFGEQETERLMKMYHVGTSYKWGGSTIYWQVDKNDKVRTGKVMLYDDKTDIVSKSHVLMLDDLLFFFFQISTGNVSLVSICWQIKSHNVGRYCRERKTAIIAIPLHP